MLERLKGDQGNREQRGNQGAGQIEQNRCQSPEPEGEICKERCDQPDETSTDEGDEEHLVTFVLTVKPVLTGQSGENVAALGKSAGTILRDYGPMILWPNDYQAVKLGL